MDIYGKHFEYAGRSSRDYDLVVASLGNSLMNSVRGSEKTESFYGRKGWSSYYLGTSWDDSPLSFSISVVRQTPLSNAEIRQVEKWLFNRPSYAKFYVDQDDDFDGETTEIIDGQEKRLYLNCKMTNPTKLVYDAGVVGFSFTVECDSGFAHQDAITKQFDIAGDEEFDGTVSITIDSDMPGYLYPRLTIAAGSGGGDITLVNMTDDSSRSTRLLGVTGSSQVIMNGATNYVSGGYYTKFPGQSFLRLRDGENIISVTGDVSSLTFVWSNVRNV